MAFVTSKSYRDSNSKSSNNVNVGGNLNVESLQDTATSQVSQKTTGIALSIPIVGTGGSASFSQSRPDDEAARSNAKR